MEEEKILDSNLNQTQTKHARLSFLLFLWTLGFMGISFLLTLIPESWIDQLQDSIKALLFGIPVLVVLITSFGGLRNAILSIRKKETWGFYKIVGLLGALIIFTTIVLLIVSNVFDVVNTLSPNE
ncbi:MAG: hypothetical protein DWQ02_03560 [Bacteroidetes bacterium]|nr:MAG: hypothetical protein DWQ02_03560 [Bacteroidota bacterium]